MIGGCGDCVAVKVEYVALGNATLCNTHSVEVGVDYLSGVEVSAEDRVITLSTCTYEFEDARYVLHGKLVPLEEG